jgi:hypothetical protein
LVTKAGLVGDKEPKWAFSKEWHKLPVDEEGDHIGWPDPEESVKVNGRDFLE